MNQKLKPASRLSVVFILVVILSGSILTYFSINNISNQKVLTEKRILEEQRELSARFSDVLQNKIENVTTGFANEISPPDLLRDSLVKKANEFDFIIQAFILKNNGGFSFPNFTGISDNLSKQKFSNRFITAFNKGEKAEFAENNFKLARENYLQCLHESTGKFDSVKALNMLGRVSVKLKEYESAVQYYNTIVLNYFNVIDENGIPFINYALPQLLKVGISPDFQEQIPVFEFCLEQMAKGTIPLNFNSEELVLQFREIIKGISSIDSVKESHLVQLENNILNQIDFINNFKDELPKLIANEGLGTRFDSENDFKIINLWQENTQKCFIINTNLPTPAGYLINCARLFETSLQQNLQQDFEFKYIIEFPTGNNSKKTLQNLIYTTQLNPYFPGQVIQIKPANENLIKDLIQRKSWIYGISTILLLVAMVLGVVLIVRDIAREKRLAQLQSDFISNVTHELKTPLTSISMFTESILLKRMKKDSDKDEYLSIILKESDRLKRMINNILEFSKMEKGKSEYRFVDYNLADILKAAIEELDYWLKKEGFEVVTELDNQISAKVDPEKMKQVFENLLNNAIKYSPQTKKINIRLYLNSDSIHIEFEDRGIGIAKNELSQIFEKFYRINHKESISGTGLGLTVVKEIVEAHNGEIIVTSEPGKGSKFSIILNRKTDIG